MNNEKTVITLISVLVGFFVVASFANALTPPQPAAVLTGLDIAKKVLPFIESLPTVKEGYSTYLKHCEGNKCIFDSAAFPQTRAWAVLAYVGLYNATLDKTYLDKAKTQMQELRKNCDPGNSECTAIGVQAEAAYQATKDKSYLDYLKFISPALTTVKVDAPKLMMNAINVRELVLAYKHNIYKNVFVIKQLLDVLYGQLKTIPTLANQNGVEFKDKACWPYLADIEFYKTLNALKPETDLGNNITVKELKATLLRDPENFFDKFDFAKLGMSPKSYYTIQMTDFEPCSEAALNLYELTGNEKYRQQAVYILLNSLYWNWDSEYVKKYDGDNAFLAQGCRTNRNGLTCYRNNKILTDNGYAAYLFSRFPKDTFGIAKASPITYIKEPNKDPDLVPTPTPKLVTGAGIFGKVALDILIILIGLVLIIFISRKNKNYNVVK